MHATEVSQENYEEMRDILPPERMTEKGFLVGEPQDHEGEGNSPRYAMYTREKGKHFFHGAKTIKEFNAYMGIPEGSPLEILKNMIMNNEIREWISKSTQDGHGIKLVEKNSLMGFDLTNQDAINLIVEYLENSVLHDQIQEPCSTPIQTLEPNTPISGEEPEPQAQSEILG